MKSKLPLSSYRMLKAWTPIQRSQHHRHLKFQKIYCGYVAHQLSADEHHAMEFGLRLTAVLQVVLQSAQSGEGRQGGCISGTHRLDRLATRSAQPSNNPLPFRPPVKQRIWAADEIAQR